MSPSSLMSSQDVHWSCYIVVVVVLWSTDVGTALRDLRPRCDRDVVVSFPDVSPFSSPLLMSSCGDHGDVVAAFALLPCENRCKKKSPQR